MRIDKIAVADSVVRRDEGRDSRCLPPECVNNHEQDLIEDGGDRIVCCRIVETGLPGHKMFIGEETSCKCQQAYGN